MILLYFICGLYVVIFASDLPYTHQILRQKNAYNAFPALAVFFALIVFLTFMFQLSGLEKDMSLLLLSPLTFMISYKYFDRVIFKKYNRHIYFRTRTRSITDDEAMESKTLDRIFQLLLNTIPILWMIIGVLLFKQ